MTPAARPAGPVAVSAADGNLAAASPAATAPARAAPRLRLSILLSPKWLISFLITAILVVGEWQFSILGSYARLVMALSVCMCTEFVLSLLIRRRVPVVQSAYISGISLTLLTKPLANALWPFALGGAIAIASKYALTWRGRHLWNPTNFAISALLLLAPGSVAILSHEFGNDLRVNAVIWTLGLLIVSRAKLLHVTGTYVLAFAVLALLRSWIIGVPFLIEFTPITGPMYQLFIFFMITDPRTTVSTRRGRILVVILIAIAEMILRLSNDFSLPWAAPFAPAPAIFALAMVGPTAMLIDLARQPRG